jgi:2-dehydropantoate 2-reductase
MRVGVFGAGAIGGLLGARLAAAGTEVTIVARGPHLAAMQARGVTVQSGDGGFVAHPRCVGSAAEAGVQDVVIVTLKAHALPKAAPDIARMLGEGSTVLYAVNGVPYWYFYGLDGPWRDRRVASVDPGGVLWTTLPPERVVGCVVYPAAEVVEPGVIVHIWGDRFSLGEPDGSQSARVQALSRLFIGAGLKAPVRSRIRDEMWVKLWGNLCFNPISALTGSTLDRITGRADLRALARGMMVEAEAVARALGVRFAITVDRRLDGAGEVGVHKTSMLQDLERGRPLEIDALLGAVVELGEMVGQPMPLSTAVLALVRERARLAGCYPEPG